MTVLDVSHLRVEFGTETGRVIAVKDVSFTLERGEIIALVGESGCGKSTVAMAIPRLLGNDGVEISGTVSFDDQNLTTVSEKDMRMKRGSEISVVFQEPMTSLNPAYTIGQQICEVLFQHEKLTKRQAMDKAASLLELVGIPNPRARLAVFPHELSGGMRQRVMIAIAVACDPKVLIADEPTTALDVTVQAGILDIFRRLRDTLGTSIVLITHDLGVVADLADRVAIMYAGRIVEHCTVAELFRNPSHPYAQGLLRALPARAVRVGERRRLADIPGFVPAPTSDPDVCQFAPRCTFATDVCLAARPVLEPTADNHEVACYHPQGESAVEGVAHV